MTASQTNMAGLAPLLAWIVRMMARIQLLNMPAYGSAQRVLASPHRAKEKSNNGEKCECGVGPFLNGFVDRVDEIVSDIAHRIDRLAALFLGIGSDAFNARTCTLPSLGAFIGDHVADLRGEAPELISQRLQVALDVTGGLAGFLAYFPNIIRNR